MSLDIARLRADTPGTAELIHFNNAGCALPPRAVVDAMTDYLRLEMEIGGYEAAARMQARLDRPYAALATLLNAQPDEIAVLENATRAWDMAFYAVRMAPGDRVLTTRTEYCSNYIAFLQRARRDGIEIDVAPSLDNGDVDLAAFEHLIGPRTKLIAITHVATSGGLVNPAAAIGAIAKRAKLPYLLDACQSVGQMAIDVEAIGCDMLSATARKFLRGPRGIGFLYVRRSMLDLLDPPFLDDFAADWYADGDYRLRADARRFETPECSFAAKVGFGVALDYALALPMAEIETRVASLAAALRTRLTDVPGVTIQDRGTRRCGIVTFTKAGIPAPALKAKLAERKINVTVSVAEATRLDLIPRGIDKMIRASVHYYNAEDGILRFAEAVEAMALEHAR
ncbi:MAG: aminotransferase class V-fold PLP-dependent enzyme [Alphaproteobacteria bacterium]|nr:aminotransferase class V-fold PLP-dependent enzyme [Alphaproteobacteria bacterium]